MLRTLFVSVFLSLAFCCAAKTFSFRGGYPAGGTSRAVGVTAGVRPQEEKAPVKTIVVRKVLTEKTLSGKVTGVGDGDSVTVTTAAGKRHEVRLYGVDAPERGQPWGTESKMALNRRIFGKNVVVRYFDVDGKAPIVGRVMLGQENVNLWMLAEGHAWWHRHSAKDDRVWREAEKSAREQKRGLWSRPGPIDPGQWRKVHRD